MRRRFARAEALECDISREAIKLRESATPDDYAGFYDRMFEEE